MDTKNVLYVVAQEGENKIMTTENYYPVPPTKTQKAIICLPEEVQAWKDENQKLSTRVEELEAQVTALKKIAISERSRCIRTESYDHCEGMYRIDLPEAIESSRRQLAEEHPEAF
jgi:predicted  nucleic acid-binding Zn-ribbon protein